ncbi:hypothetical protein KIN20_019009 [Parelaphostrongylus tenuis]|nr:hypothetical protein KIN20_019009 [Parelaphostrongylus tenuis]
MVLQQFVSESKRFCIDLCCGLLVHGDHMDNKALHINPRFDTGGGWFSAQPDRHLVINSFISNRWGSEERFPNPFEPGQPFQLRILVLENYFKIAVNGKHICDYPHRVPVEEVKTIYIGGNIRVDFIEFQPAVRINNEGKPVVTKEEKREEKVTALERPLMPFSWVLPAELKGKGFTSPQCIRFTLTPYVSGKRFTCNLMAGEEHFFHFRVDLRNQNDKGSKDAVVRGSTKNLVWQKEERDITRFPFSKGITSDILFIAYDSRVSVDVDGVPFLSFRYRDGDDPKLIDRITVNGDCVLHRFVHKA